MRAIFALFLVSALAVLGSGASAAPTSGLFEVHNIPVDATAASAAEARDAAFAQGQTQAFDILMRRLTLKSDWGRLPSSAGQDYKRLVAGFSVNDEKRSTTRYIANFTYVFSPERIRGILRGAGLSFSETRSRPILVLPVAMTVGGAPLLFEPDNSWAQAWRDRLSAQGLVPFVVATGDPASLPASSLLAQPSYSQVESLAGQNGASSAVMAVLTMKRAGTQIEADVRAVELKPGKTNEWSVSASGADEKSAMQAAVDAVSETINESWKQTTVVASGEAASLVADVTYPDMGSWLRIRRSLDVLPTIRAVKVIALAADGAEIEIDYAGTSDQLAVSLQQQDLLLTPGTEGRFGLSLAAGAMPAPALSNAGPVATPSTPPDH